MRCSFHIQLPSPWDTQQRGLWTVDCPPGAVLPGCPLCSGSLGAALGGVLLLLQAEEGPLVPSFTPQLPTEILPFSAGPVDLGRRHSCSGPGRELGLGRTRMGQCMN